MTAPVRRRNTPPPHGTRRRYAYWKCRCPACREAERLYEKRHRENRATSEFIHPVGTARRIQALVAHGHTYQAIADELDCKPSWVSQLARADLASRPRGILRRTAERVTALYDRLTGLPAPQGRGATYARTVAGKYGWRGPDYWAGWDDIDQPPEQEIVDEVALARAARGDRAVVEALTDHERETLARQLLTQGASQRCVLEATGLPERRVRALRNDLRDQAQGRAA